MITTDQARRLIEGRGHVLGADGEKIGTIGQIFVDDRTDEPQWVTANTGLFGMGESFVPLQGAEISGDDLRVPHDKATVKDAPRISDADAHLSPEDEDRLYSHYGLDDRGPHVPADTHDDLRRDRDSDRGPVQDQQLAGDPLAHGDAAHTDLGREQPRDTTRAEHHDRSHDDHHEVPTSENGLPTSVPPPASASEPGDARPTQRMRVRKYVVTEDVNITVPVTHEEVRIEQEPITDDGTEPLDGPLDDDRTNRG